MLEKMKIESCFSCHFNYSEEICMRVWKKEQTWEDRQREKGKIEHSMCNERFKSLIPLCSARTCCFYYHILIKGENAKEFEANTIDAHKKCQCAALGSNEVEEGIS